MVPAAALAASFSARLRKADFLGGRGLCPRLISLVMLPQRREQCLPCPFAIASLRARKSLPQRMHVAGTLPRAGWRPSSRSFCWYSRAAWAMPALHSSHLQPRAYPLRPCVIRLRRHSRQYWMAAEVPVFHTGFEHEAQYPRLLRGMMTALSMVSPLSVGVENARHDGDQSACGLSPPTGRAVCVIRLRPLGRSR